MTPLASILHSIICNVRPDDLKLLADLDQQVGVANARLGNSAIAQANTNLFNACDEAINNIPLFYRHRLSMQLIEKSMALIAHPEKAKEV